MLNKYFNISNKLQWLRQQYRAYKSYSTRHTQGYRLLSFNTGEQQPANLTIQISGTTNTVNMNPYDILADEQMVQQFSSSDIRTITYLACQIPQVNRRILAQRFCPETGNILFTLKDAHGEPVELDTKTIAKDKDIIAKLSPQEAYTIGFTTATEWANRDGTA